MTRVDSRREIVLAFLKSRGQATLADVAAHLDISKQGALHHLEALETDRLVTVHTEGHGRGRPENVYSLTAAAADHFPHSHRELASDLVEFLDEAQLREFFEKRAARIEAQYAPKLAGLDFQGRVRELAKLASEHGHMAEVVEMPGGGLAIRHCNCPIQDVAGRTALPCQNERDMYERLLGAPVERSTWLREAAADCTYEVKESKHQIG
jgi:predicted ArsR family transcriptional regulator